MSTQTERKCPVCGTQVYYGITCGKECADKSYQEWKEKQEDREPFVQIAPGAWIRKEYVR